MFGIFENAWKLLAQVTGGVGWIYKNYEYTSWTEIIAGRDKKTIRP